MKVFDIVKPRNKWEHGFAHLEYLRGGLHLIGAKRIKVVEPEDELIKILDAWLLPGGRYWMRDDVGEWVTRDV